MSNDMKALMKVIKNIDGVDHTLNALSKHTKKLVLTQDEFYRLSLQFIRIADSNLQILKDLLVNQNKICDVSKKYRKSKQTVYALNRVAYKKHLLTQIPDDWVCVSLLLPQSEADHLISYSTKKLNTHFENVLN